MYIDNQVSWRKIYLDYFSDLFRACDRISNIFDPSNNEDVFHVLYDLWIAPLSKSEFRLRICMQISEDLSISNEHANFLTNVRKPEIVLDDDSVIFGRCRLPRIKNSSSLINR